MPVIKKMFSAFKVGVFGLECKGLEEEKSDIINTKVALDVDGDGKNDEVDIKYLLMATQSAGEYIRSFASKSWEERNYDKIIAELEKRLNISVTYDDITRVMTADNLGDVKRDLVKTLMSNVPGLLSRYSSSEVNLLIEKFISEMKKDGTLDSLTIK